MDDRVNPYAPPADESQAPPLVAEVVVDEAGWTIEFTLTVEDLVAWNTDLQRTSPTLRRQFYLAWGAVGTVVVVMAIFCVSILPRDEGVSAGITMLVVGGTFWALFPLLRRRANRRLAMSLYREGTNYNMFGPRRLTLSDDYVVFSSPLSQTIVRWQGVESVRTAKDGLYILLSSLTAVIAPRRAFAGQDEFDRFAERAFELRQRAAQAAGTTHLRS